MRGSESLTSVLSRPTRALVIEDERRYRGFLVETLGDMGCEAQGVESAVEALEALRGAAFDVLLLDLIMPVMDGLTFLERFRRTDKATPVIILTGVGDLESAQQAIRLGVTEFLTKPCTLGAIEAAVDRARRQIARTSQQSTGEAVAAEPAPAAGGRTIADLERVAIIEAIERHDGNRTAAANELGISRRTLYNKLGRYRGEGD